MKPFRPLPGWQRGISGLLAVLIALPAHIPLLLADSAIARIAVNDGGPNRSTVTNLTVTLSNGYALAPDGIALRQLPFGPAFGATNLLLTALGHSNQYRVTFPGMPGASLPGGNIFASIMAVPATNAGGPRVSESVALHRLFGDQDGDRDVDFEDTFWARQTWPLAAGNPAFDPRFDFDGDGLIGTNDLAAFNTNYFTLLPPASALFAHLDLDDGLSPTDHFTSDPAISGMAHRTNNAARLFVEVAPVSLPTPPPLTRFVHDATAALSASGAFSFSASHLAQLYSASFVAGIGYVARFQLVETNDSVSARFDLPFALSGACLLEPEGWLSSVAPPVQGDLAAPGTVTFSDCGMILTEGRSFAVSAERPLTIPPGMGLLRIEYEAPTFDGSSTGQMQDAFEMALADESGKPLVFTIQGAAGIIPPGVAQPPAFPANADAFFNHSHGQPPFVAPGAALVQGVRNAVYCDVSHLAAGTAARLVLRLVNNDRDRATSVRITGLAFQFSDPALNLAGSPSTALSLLRGGIAGNIRTSASTALNFSGSSQPGIVTIESLPPAGPDGSPAFPPILEIATPGRTASSVAGVPLLISGVALAQGIVPVENPNQNVFVKFENFSNTSLLTLNLSATPTNTPDGTVLRLVPSSDFQAGSAFSQQRVNAADFSTYFRFRISNARGLDGGADGLVFVVQSISSSIGAVGGGLGYEGIPDSIGVEFDTFDNGPVFYNDPDSNHLAIDTRGSFEQEPGAPNPLPITPNFDNGQLWHAWIDYDGAFLQVRVSQSETRPELPTLSRALNIPALIKGTNAYVGFTAGTGAGMGDHDITYWQYNDAYSPIGVLNRISQVAVNGVPVETLDAAGNFTAPVTVNAGRNIFTVAATDSLGHTSFRRISLTGFDTPSNSSTLENISASVTGGYGRTSFNDQTEVLYADTALVNSGTYAIKSPFYVGITRISDPSVRLLEPDGLSQDGVPYYDFSAALVGGSLPPGGTSARRALAFHNPNKAQFSYEFEVLGQLNRPPQFTSAPLLFAVTGKPYRYRPEAADPDGDAVTYSLPIAPTGMTWNAEQGILVWTPETGQAGNHEIKLVADDGNGGTAEQTFILSATLPGSNRPPVFTSQPVTFAELLPEEDPTNGEYIYDADAVDWDYDDLTYSIVTGPANARIDARTGLIAWNPKPDEAGTHLLSIAAQDGNGGVATQAFTVCLFPASPGGAPSRPSNTPPLLLAALPSVAVAGLPFVAELQGQDAEENPLVFGVNNPPAGFTLNATNGIVAWTPTLSQVGTNWVELTVADSQGASSRLTLPITVVSSAPNAAPRFTTSPRQHTRIETPYLYTAKADDLNGDPLAFSLVSGPVGMVLTNRLTAPDGTQNHAPFNGAFLVWNPAFGQLGAHPVTLRASDGQGGIAEQSFTLAVNSALGNSRPLIVSSPPPAAAVETLYSYDLRAEDTDGDAVSWRLVSGPAGMSVNAQTGSLRWIPTSGQLGTNTVMIEAQDGFLAADRQTFSLVVSCGNHAPAIRSVPPVIAHVNALYLYAPRGEDPEGDSLRWSLADAPAGMTVDSSSGLIRWTPEPRQLGTHPVRLRLSDGSGGEDTQLFAVRVTDLRANTAPVIVSTPIRGAAPGQPYAYKVRATDADGDALTLRLLAKPDGAVLIPGVAAEGITEGTVTWTPSPGTTGSHEFIIVASDPSGANAAQRFSVVIRPNNPPQIVSSPRTNAVPGLLYRYDIIATDPDGNPLTYAITSPAPDGMTMDLFGRLVWPVPQSQSNHVSLAIVVSDGMGGSASQSFLVTVGPDTEPPNVSLFVNHNLEDAQRAPYVQVGTEVSVKVIASDNVGIASLGLTVDGSPVPLESNGLAMVPFNRIGSITAVASAIDLAGNRAAVTNLINVVDKDALSSVSIAIHSPTNGAAVTRPTAIIGTITSKDAPLHRYQVDVAELTLSDSATQIAVADPRLRFQTLTNVTLPPGVMGLTNAALTRFDPTTLLNGPYLIRVTAYDANQQGRQEGVLVSVTGELKFGEFRLEFTDLQVPLAGIPITVSRVYDSREAFKEGDFGYGWRLGTQDAQIRALVKNGALFEGSRVYLTSPDGRRLGFTAYSYDTSWFIFGQGKIGLRPDPGIYDQLSFGEDNAVGIMNGVYYSNPITQTPWNPSRYRLRTKEGTIYEYDKDSGLKSVTDLNGNRIIYGPEGIFHYNAGSLTPSQQVRFTRDPQGRITHVTDPAGNQLRYAYDAVGDLRSFTDQAGSVTRYLYDTTRAHFLTNIVDPFGKDALKLVYDDTGRLKEVLDVAGNPLKQDFDADANTGAFTDGRGNQTIVKFDDRGNETQRTVPGISTNFFAYDENNNLTNAVNARGYATNFVYNARGDLTRITDALSNVTDIAYNDLGKPTFITNALKQVLQLRYDAAGNLTQIINNLGHTNRIGRDHLGRMTNLVDAVGNITSYLYEDGCSCGKPGRIINPDQSFRRFEYNAFGQTTLEVSELGAETRHRFDDAGRLLWTQDALTNITRYFYDGNRLTNITDALGRETRFLYDEFGRTNFIITAEGGTNEFRYDPNGNRTHVIDAVSNVTRFVYNADNRVTNRIDTFGRTNHFVYDPAGNQVEAIDRNGRRRTFAYDPLNRMTNEVWWEGTNVVKSISFAFNELGAQTLAADDMAHYDYRYNGLNQLERVIQSAVPGQPDFTLNYTYTPNGQVESVTDHWGVQVGSKYDPRNRLKTRTWRGPEIDPARVDFDYLADGNRQRIDRYADLEGVNRIGFTTNAYNHAGIVTNITHLGPTGAVLAKYDYAFDPAYQIRQWNINGQLSQFDHDRTGQLTNALHAAQPNESYRFDPNGNRLGAQSSGIYAVGGNNQILSDGTYAYSHDLEGNMTSRTSLATGAITRYIWDHRNRLESVIDYNSLGTVTQTVQFSYDAMNRRLSKTVDGKIVRFLYNGDDSWVDLTANNTVTARYLHGARIDELLARQRTSDGRGWYLTDHLGTVRGIVNATGSIAARIDYNSFGQVINVSNPTAMDRFLFTGREFDGETGLYFYRARYLAPDLGRFISEDPIAFEVGILNRFAYVENSPLLFSDPSGLVALSEYSNLVRNIVINARGCLADLGIDIAIDFVVTSEPLKWTGLYFFEDLRDADKRGYVGRSSDIERRIKQHLRKGRVELQQLLFAIGVRGADDVVAKYIRALEQYFIEGLGGPDKAISNLRNEIKKKKPGLGCGTIRDAM